MTHTSYQVVYSSDAKTSASSVVITYDDRGHEIARRPARGDEIRLCREGETQ